MNTTLGKTLLIIGIIAIIIGAGVFFFYTYVGVAETPTEFGAWGQQILVKYEGSDEIAPLDFIHNGKKVEEVHYVLSAKATGGSGSNLLINLENYEVVFSIEGQSLTPYTLDFTETSLVIPIDGKYHNVIVKAITVNSIIGGLPDGSYTLKAVPGGSITYAIDEEEPTSVNLPGNLENDNVNIETPPISYTLTVTPLPAGSGYVTFNPAGGIYTSGTTVSVIATANSGYSFSNWAEGITGTDNPKDITMNSDIIAIAVFTEDTEYELLNTYQEVDPIDYMTLMSNNQAIQITNMLRDATCYYQKARPIGNGDFTLTFKVSASLLEKSYSTDSSGGNLCVMLVKNQTTTNQAISQKDSDGVIFTFRNYNGTDGKESYLLQLRSRGPEDVLKEVPGALNTEYDITISRTSGIITYTVESDSSTVFTATLVDGTDIQYFIPMCGRGQAGPNNAKSTGIVKNFLFTPKNVM